METGFLDRSIEFGGQRRRFVVYVPEGYAGHPMPAMVHLHGRGESGTDGLFQLWNSVPRYVIRARDRWPMILICPQKESFDSQWADEKPMLNAILRQCDREFSIDPNRRYLCGLSQGGRGTLMLASKLEWHFAALAPICGWTDDPKMIADEIGKTPIWLFHGLADTVVPPKGSTDVADALVRLGAEPKLSLYEGVGHNAWDKACEDPVFPKWLLSQSLRNDI